MVIKLIQQDIEDISSDFPKLKGDIEEQVVSGDIKFCCWFDKGKIELEHNSKNKEAIEDTYHIKIDFKENDTWGFPKIYEDRNKIKEYADSKNIKLEKLHINRKGDCCLGILYRYKWEGLLKFIQKKVISFFYWQSHLNIHGEEPWEGHKHGNEGIYEVMTLSPENATKGNYRNIVCPCKSGKKYKKCCLDNDKLLKSKLSPPHHTKKQLS